MTDTARAQWAFRETVAANDPAHVRSITTESGNFSAEEVVVAEELVQEYLDKGVASGYQFVFVDGDDEPLGYACYGRIAMTMNSWDLYWIAVRRQLQSQGLGKAIVQRVEQLIAAQGGGQLFVETAGRPAYEGTRAFYARSGYATVARFADFYSDGDDKVVFVKRLAAHHGAAG